MIAMGAGTNHWYHSDEIYRTFFTLIMLCGCQGVNGGGWAHYVGQEKVRPLAGWQQVAFALDWQRPPRHMTGTSFFYLHTGQWRYERSGPAELASPLGRGLFTGKTFADCLAQAARLGWTPSHPAFGRSPLDLADDFMRHLLGTHDAVRAAESPGAASPGEDPRGPRGPRPAEVTWREQAPRGKLDLLTAIDFRMTSTCTFADVVQPAATWYEVEFRCGSWPR